MDTPEIIAAANDILTQGLELLFDLDTRCYSKIANAPLRTSIGKQYRKVLDHFAALVKGLKSNEIDYRHPGNLPRVEADVTSAAIATCDILRALKSHTKELARSCEVIPDGDSRIPSFTSTMNREIAYCVGNALHHYGIIRVLCAELGLSVPDAFGMTPSTFRYRAAAAAD